MTRALEDPAWRVVRFGIPIAGSEDLGAGFYNDYKSLEILDRTPGWLHLVGVMDRPFVTCFARQLELTYYPPRSSRNERYFLHWVRWLDLLFLVVTIPSEDRRFAERVCGRFQLRIADGVPHVFEGGRDPQTFPMRSPSVFSIEFAKEFPHELVNTRAGRDQLSLLESRAMVEMEVAFKATERRN